MRAIPVICVAAMALASESVRAQDDQIDTIAGPQDSALTAYWTPQRLRDAILSPVPVVDAATGRRLVESEPGPTEQSETPSAIVTDSGTARASGNVGTRPLYWAGKFYFTKPEGDRVCSAQYFEPGILITAAHCVRNNENGRWYTNFLYRHQFERGRYRGEYGTDCAATKRGWVSKDYSRYAFDYAFVKLRGSPNYGAFGNSTGWWGKYPRAPKIGYPGEIERGQVIQVEFGRLIKGQIPQVVGLNHGNPRNANGSSGGAWVGKYETQGVNPQSNYIISVTSHHIGDDKGTTFGPYWKSQELHSLRDKVKGPCR